MAHPFKVAVFDLDGTLLDTSDGVLESVRYTIDKMGFEKLSDEKLCTFIGPPIQNSFASHYGLSGDILQEIAGVFRDRYKNVDLLKATPYDGIYDLFESLIANGIVPVVATYKREDYAVMLLKHYGFDKYTDKMFGADHENKLSKSDIIEIALNAAGLSRDDYDSAVMIGDSDNDAIGAERIGIKFIGVTYGFGFHSKEDVYKYNAVGAANTTMEVKGLILGGYNED